MKHRTRTVLAVASCTLALAACSTTDPDAAGTDSGDGGSDVETGAGVTDETIGIGMLTDLSGPFAAGAAVQVAETQGYWDRVNADGGICGRDIELQVQDHGYDPQKAVSLFRSMSSDVIALQQVLGGPTSAAVLPLAQQDGMYLGGHGWASVALEYENAQIPGTTYSVESANAVDYLVDELGLQEGDKIGVVYFVGDFGSDSLAGAQYAAAERGLEIVPVEITPRDTDLSAQVSALQEAGVQGVILGAAPAQLASLAGVMGSLGMDIPIIGNTPTFGPSLLETTAGPTLLENFYTTTSIAPYSSDEPGPQAAAELYEEVAPDGELGWEVPLAYAQGELLRDAIEGACEAGTLTPEGVVTAMRETSDLETQGLFATPLDYTEVTEPPTRTVYVSRADADAPGGLAVVDTFEGPSAASYGFE
ncbi:ABC transporter substrate-binding protein [Blastococcus xanthinilyticus]|uniref:Amino acid/amide ABC transporter substrate-binding protein (HAAT family) n=1 Tax=Blastococcus xanthinilyticus TaxID=1564164 RepID=A0A5S5D2R6_9ACTN|nr:ABC transporter substrate-binding protein [Blastococcus xanthinilyticus]TYP90323.1 amino acid/amide ABC transporter substrate-binding protein (HAAT family) [Blastococcus xanthinilyticus]